MDMQDWDESVGEPNQKSQKFQIFYNDQNQSEIINFKRQLDEGGPSDFCLSQQFKRKSPIQTSDEPLQLPNTVLEIINEREQQISSTPPQQRQSRKKKEYNGSQYSKVYRQKKKQKMKILQEENNYLKKKVDELQMRLREKEMEINQLKFTSPQQHDIKVLNQEIMSKLKIISQPTEKSQQQKPKNIPEQKPVLTGDKRMEEFLRMFDLFGFGGVKAKQLLEYYVNEYIENVMRDRQKYYFMKWVNRKHQDKNAEKTAFQYDLEQSYCQTQQQQKESTQISILIRPVTLELLIASREIYKHHQAVLRALQKIHSTFRSVLSKNIDYTQKRMKMVMWFQANRHRKQMREIRQQWREMVKSSDEPWLEDKHKKAGKKKVVK